MLSKCFIFTLHLFLRLFVDKALKVVHIHHHDHNFLHQIIITFYPRWQQHIFHCQSGDQWCNWRCWPARSSDSWSRPPPYQHTSFPWIAGKYDQTSHNHQQLVYYNRYNLLPPIGAIYVLKRYFIWSLLRFSLSLRYRAALNDYNVTHGNSGQVPWQPLHCNNCTALCTSSAHLQHNQRQRTCPSAPTSIGMLLLYCYF